MSDIEELEQKIDKLEDLIIASKPSMFSKINLGTIITVVLLGVGVVGSWFTMQAEVEDLKGDIAKIVEVQEEQADEIEGVKLKGVQDSSDIQHIREKVDAIDRKLDKFTGN